MQLSRVLWLAQIASSWGRLAGVDERNAREGEARDLIIGGEDSDYEHGKSREGEARDPRKDSFNTRIIGGEYSDFGEYPYAVSLKRGNGHFCGGSLIARGASRVPTTAPRMAFSEPCSRLVSSPSPMPQMWCSPLRECGLRRLGSARVIALLTPCLALRRDVDIATAAAAVTPSSSAGTSRAATLAAIRSVSERRCSTRDTGALAPTTTSA